MVSEAAVCIALMVLIGYLTTIVLNYRKEKRDERAAKVISIVNDTKP